LGFDARELLRVGMDLLDHQRAGERGEMNASIKAKFEDEL
jgi:hypothetical protein